MCFAYLLISRFGVRVPDGVLRKSFNDKGFRFFIGAAVRAKWVLVPEVGPQNSGYLVGTGEISEDRGGTRVPRSVVEGAFPSSESSATVREDHDSGDPCWAPNRQSWLGG